MVNPNKSSQPLNDKIEIQANQYFECDKNENINVSSTMAPSSFCIEDRNILFCGARGCGKTSLIFTIARGIFPGSFSPDITPGRFEGWSLSACAIPTSSSSTASNLPSASAVRLSHGGKEKIKPYHVNLTFWEDRPRLNLSLEECDSSSSDDDESNANSSGKGINGKEKGSYSANGNVASVDARRSQEATGFKVSGTVPPNNSQNGTSTPSSRVHHIHGQQQTHRLGRRRSSAKPLKNGAKQVDEANVSFAESLQPKRIWPIPEPDVLVLCYSAIDMASYIEVESEIVPEVMKRFPRIPVILVATKDDMKTNFAHPTFAGDGSVHKHVFQEVSNSTEYLPARENDPHRSASRSVHNSATRDMGVNNKLRDIMIVTSEMGHALKRRIGARAFIECSAKEQTQLRKIVEEAVWISYQSWFHRNLLLPKNSNFVGCNQKVERKWSLAAQLSSSWPMSSWSNSSGTVNAVSSAAATAQNSAMASTSNKDPQIAREVNANFLNSGASSRNSPRPQESEVSLRPLITIQDPFSSQCFSGINSAVSSGSLSSSFVGNRQRKQSYGRAAVRKIWHTYSGGGGGSASSKASNSISSSSSSSSAASTVTSRQRKS